MVVYCAHDREFAEEILKDFEKKSGLKVDVIYDTVADRVLLRITENVTPQVPEPETYALMLGGLGLVAWMARRRRRQG